MALACSHAHAARGACCLYGWRILAPSTGRSYIRVESLLDVQGTRVDMVPLSITSRSLSLEAGPMPPSAAALAPTASRLAIL